MKKNFKQLLDICRNNGFFQSELIENNVRNIKSLSLGNLLNDNIQKQWISSDDNTNNYLQRPSEIWESTNLNDFNEKYFNTLDFKEKFQSIKNNFQKEVPFGLSEIIPFKVENCDEQIEVKSGNILSCSYFINESSCNEIFHKIQRQRKIWWMKFSANPGRFFISDPVIDPEKKNLQTVSIKSKFNFGDLEVEKLQMFSLKDVLLDYSSDFNLRAARTSKRITPFVIKNEIVLQRGGLTVLMDAIDSSINHSVSIHRKIAPFQCCIFCFTEDEDIMTELSDLSQFIAITIRKAGLTTLNLERSKVTTAAGLEKEFTQMDKYGIPYGLIVNSDSLKSGLLQLRNRETTISEIIHISDIPNYLFKIFNSQ